MPRTTIRRVLAVALLALAVATSAFAGQLGEGRHNAPHHPSLLSALIHLLGAANGTVDPNGFKSGK